MSRGKKEPKKEKIICSSCGNSKDPSRDYYSSHSPFHKHTSRLHVCKDCFWEYVNEDMERFKSALRGIDKPYLADLIKSSKEESDRTDKNPFAIYMKNVVMPQYRNFTWEDSDFEGFKKTGLTNINELNNNETEDDIDFAEVSKYWGNGYANWEYDFLEDERIKLMSSFECPDYGMEMIMKDICFINLDIEKVRQERKPNSGKEITALIKTRSDLMNDANMKPIQATGAEANDQITFGTLIKKWENERPVPKPLEDEMKEYIDTFMVGHLAKMEGLNNELTEKYDEALSKYTINFSEINRDNEEFDD